MTELETRSFEVRLEADTREIVGIAVPYGQRADIGGVYEEEFAPGAIRSVEDVKLFWQHSEAIGKVVSGRDTEDGFEIRAVISSTPRGDEAYTLLKDNVINKFSVGFVPVEQTREGNVITRTLVDLREVSVVNWPAFSLASISEVREEQPVAEVVADSIRTKETHMSENMEMDVRTVQDEVAEIRRELELVKTPTIATNAFETKFRSQGEYAKALVSGDPDAVELFRATSADAALRPAFVGYINNLINSGRPTLSAFNIQALPATGLSIEYAQVNTNTIAIGKQTTENTALSTGDVALTTVSVPVATYGGFTNISKQAIERSTVNYLDVAFQAMSLAYAKKMNVDFIAAIATISFAGAKTVDASALTAAAVMGAIADGAAKIYNDTGLLPEFIVAGVTAYKRLVSIVDTAGRPVVSQVGDGSNTIGGSNIPGLQGSILGIPIVVDPALGASLAYMANSAALTTYESAGTPTRLSSTDVTKLQDTYSVYGYAAFAVPFSGAIIKINTGA
jgi:HK97 family phage prohead protease/HK97 family phage major capsid protein